MQIKFNELPIEIQEEILSYPVDSDEELQDYDFNQDYSFILLLLDAIKRFINLLIDYPSIKFQIQ